MVTVQSYGRRRAALAETDKTNFGSELKEIRKLTKRGAFTEVREHNNVAVRLYIKQFCLLTSARKDIGIGKALRKGHGFESGYFFYWMSLLTSGIAYK